MSKLTPLQLDGTYTLDFHRRRTALSCSPSATPPPAPNYVQAAKEQGVQNVEAARTQGRINNPNVIGPTGTQTVSWAGDTPTITQKLSPEQEALYNQGLNTQRQLGQVAGQGATALEGVVGTPVDFSGAPQTGNYDTTRQSVINAMMSRAQEDYTKRIDQDRSNLVAAGIRPGSKAYNDNQQMTERALNDYRQQAEIAGGNAASQAYGMDADRRKQTITEMLAQRQTPINEISALMSGSQVSNPFSTPGYAQNSQVQPAPLFAAQNAAGQYGTDVYNAQMASQGNTQSGLFGLGGTAIMGGALLL